MSDQTATGDQAGSFALLYWTNDGSIAHLFSTAAGDEIPGSAPEGQALVLIDEARYENAKAEPSLIWNEGAGALNVAPFVASPAQVAAQIAAVAGVRARAGVLFKTSADDAAALYPTDPESLQLMLGAMTAIPLGLWTGGSIRRADGSFALACTTADLEGLSAQAFSYVKAVQDHAADLTTRAGKGESVSLTEGWPAQDAAPAASSGQGGGGASGGSPSTSASPDPAQGGSPSSAGAVQASGTATNG